MKKILKLSIITLFATIISCTTEPKDPVTVANGLSVNKDNSVPTLNELTLLNLSSVFGKYDWSLSDNGATTIATKYELVVFDHDNDPNLLNPSVYTGTGLVVTLASRKATITSKELNELIYKLPTFKCSEMNIDIRIRSSVGANPANAFIQYSNPINYKVTGYKLTPFELAFATTALNINSALKLKSSKYDKKNDFEAYAYLTAGNYKFYQPDACGDFTTPTIIGKGSTAGSLTTNGADINVAVSGHYIINVNLTTNTYTLTEYTAIGAFGRATRGGSFFGQTVPFTYDNTKMEWSGSLDLLEGQPFKVKAIKWTGALTIPTSTVLPQPNFVPTSTSTSYTLFGKGGSDNILTDGGANIVVPGTASLTSTKKYKITVNVSKTRDYTYNLELVP
jgi:starch-binding outer membrane protein SusE/F